MDVAEFLYPRDLEVTPTHIRKILFIGSCLSEAYVSSMRTLNPNTQYDHILFNNAADLPQRSDDDLLSYDLQYIQLPLRSILTDAVVRIADPIRSETSVSWIELGKSNIDRMLNKAMAYNQQNGMLTLISTFFVPQGHIAPSIYDFKSNIDITSVVAELNSYIAVKARQCVNTYISDVDVIANSLGKRFFMDDFVGFYAHGHVHYPDWGEGNRIEHVPPFRDTYENRLPEFLSAVSRQIEVIYRISRQIDQVKVVIFDLDNTLWRGQLAEDYQPGSLWPHSHGWPLGVWEAVHHLRWRGIMTALASKNDIEIITARWDDAVNPPFVKFEDFISPQINWEPKAENVTKILRSLSLTAKSAVFVDDNPVEREAVKAALPEIRVIGSNPYLTRRILLWSPETQIARQTEETRRREEMLQKQMEREKERLSVSQDAFLKDLSARVELWDIRNFENKSFSRVLELVNKTNQFNTKGIRWSIPDFQKFWNDGGRLFAFSVRDKFTDYGIVGAVFVMGAELNQFVMSCRVIGMEVEIAVLDAIIGEMRASQPQDIVGEIVFSPVNTPCRDLFVRSGFSDETNEGMQFRLPQGSRPVPARFTTVTIL